MISIVLLLLLGLALSAFFSGSETGFYRVTRVRLVMDAKSGRWLSRMLLWLANHSTVVVATVLIGNAIFSAEPLQGADPGANFLADYNSVNRMLVSPVSDRARLLLRPLPGKLLGVDLQMGEFAALPEFDRDFANALRKPSGYGAFDPTVIPGPQE